ncbi:hypothetical protein BD410DRAFT_873656 [Rickenella mellea]|uniref:Uncharacterized protein n=1 Tax=Rickenella mellea TaxID=50990 RepID=A0A4Y7PZ73_9AGAM|nr:hypothetical protein BD410DRAFT_873656 [Rickenella mellea]
MDITEISVKYWKKLGARNISDLQVKRAALQAFTILGIFVSPEYSEIRDSFESWLHSHILTQLAPATSVIAKFIERHLIQPEEVLEILTMKNSRKGRETGLRSPKVGFYKSSLQQRPPTQRVAVTDMYNTVQQKYKRWLRRNLAMVEIAGIYRRKDGGQDHGAHVKLPQNSFMGYSEWAFLQIIRFATRSVLHQPSTERQRLRLARTMSDQVWLLDDAARDIRITRCEHYIPRRLSFLTWYLSQRGWFPLKHIQVPWSCTNVRRQVQCIWRGKWTSGKVLYIAGRYPIFFMGVIWEIYNMGLGSHNFDLSGHAILLHLVCFSSQPLGGWMCQIPMQIILVLRTVAIWERNRKVTFLLVVGALIHNVSALTSNIVLTRSIRYHPDPAMQALLACYSGFTGISIVWSKLGFAALMLFDTIMFSLILTKTVQDGRSTHTRLIPILFRDGAIYYAVLFALSIANIAVANSANLKASTLEGALSPALVVAHSIGASHVVLNLRKYSYGGQMPTEQISGIQYMERLTIIDEFSRPGVFRDVDELSIDSDESSNDRYDDS